LINLKEIEEKAEIIKKINNLRVLWNNKGGNKTGIKWVITKATLNKMITIVQITFSSIKDVANCELWYRADLGQARTKISILW